MLQVNDPAPDFSLQDDRGQTFTLSGHRGRRVLLVFYPGDDTPVCTRQLCDYRDGIEAFEGLGVEVVGIRNVVLGQGLGIHHIPKQAGHLPAVKT